MSNWWDEAFTNKTFYAYVLVAGSPANDFSIFYDSQTPENFGRLDGPTSLVMTVTASQTVYGPGTTDTLTGTWKLSGTVYKYDAYSYMGPGSSVKLLGSSVFSDSGSFSYKNTAGNTVTTITSAAGGIESQSDGYVGISDEGGTPYIEVHEGSYFVGPNSSHLAMFYYGAAPASAATGGSSTSNNLIQEGTSGNDTLTGTAGNDTLSGGAGNDSISAGAGNDSISGGEGNDNINGGQGNDYMAGGSGADTYVVDASGDKVIEDNNTSNGTDGAALPINVAVTDIVKIGRASCWERV